MANSTLWFVHHLLYDTPQPARSSALAFRREWESFRAYNAAFADALAEARARPGAGRGAMVQDYHLTLVPRMLAERRPDVRIAHFSHTPWAPPDYFRMLPDDVGREVLDGHARRRPRRVPQPALGRRVPGLLRGDARRGGGPGRAARSATAAT